MIWAGTCRLAMFVIEVLGSGVATLAPAIATAIRDWGLAAAQGTVAVVWYSWGLLEALATELIERLLPWLADCVRAAASDEAARQVVAWLQGWLSTVLGWVLAGILFAGVIWALSELVPRHWGPLRPRSLGPALLLALVVAFKYDTVKDNDASVPAIGGTVVLWLLLSWAVRSSDQRQRVAPETAAFRRVPSARSASTSIDPADGNAARTSTIRHRRGGGGGGGSTDRSATGGANAAPTPVAPAVQYETAECTICMEVWQPEEHRATLRCGHLFHEECIREWMHRQQNCPVCRTAARDGHWAVDIFLR